MSTPIDRRAFLRVLGSGSAALVLAPLTTACSSSAAPASGAASAGGEAADPLAIPLSKPARWEPIAFNRARGHAGAIPESYWPSIDGDDGAANHLGKHLPYIPTAADATAPEGMVAIMWGDPEKGHARHPNAVRSDANQGEGHWYNWIEIREATDDDAPSARSTYPEWPGDADGGFAVAGGGELTDDGGKNTVYLAALPAGVGPGDTVRIYAHCLTHGEYVDFLVLPG
jgi:hypothetical protein